MTEANIFPVEINCKNLRVERQKENNNIMLRLLITGDTALIKRFCNNKELDRLLEDLEINEAQLLYKCSFDLLFAKSIARQISKMASRQGTKDETFILEKCNTVLSRIGIQIENLSTTAFRPTKDGRVLNKNEYKKSNLKKNDCLKSFDAKLSGRIDGWVFAKIAYGKGGHQDNVFAEAHEFGEWVKQYGENNKLYVILIDTDLNSQFRDLKDKFNGGNTLVCNHVEFQQFCLERY